MGKHESSFGDSAPSTQQQDIAGQHDVLVHGERVLKFNTFFHPFVCDFVRGLNKSGLSGLLNLENQERVNNGEETQSQAENNQVVTTFESVYAPTQWVDPGYPKEDVDFATSGAYSIYNWELFFHAVLMIADRLSKNQRFPEAQKAFHYIFDPTTNSTEGGEPARYWKVLPFFGNSKAKSTTEKAGALVTIEELLTKLSKGDPDLIDQVKEWQEDPFNPHLIARLRITPYQKTVVMKYLDNLIAWGDQLFSRDTIESINEATQLYIMAYNILGTRPQDIPSRGKIQVETYATLKTKLDSFSNVLVQMENEFPFASENVGTGKANGKTVNGTSMAPAFYFCIPKNEQLLTYWDTVEDRLFKIRHCMNIEGIVRQLPLFEPPIDPALLVRARAMGLDLNSVLNDLYAPLPHYRFSYLLQKAVELCGEVKSLGSALLSALEKKDAEELAVLRSGHEIAVLKAAKDVKQQQIQEVRTALTALQKTRAVTEERQKFYDMIEHRSGHEKEQLDRLEQAQTFQELANLTEIGVALAALIPTVTIGISGSFSSPVSTASFGGTTMATALQSASRLLSWKAGYESYKANMASIKGGWDRRSDDWNLQKRLATKELAQIDQQVLGAEIRIAIAEKELENHEKQIENSEAVDEFMRNKYTNQELYTWMISQISAVFFQSYKLAYDLAKRAEKAYRFECGVTSSDFIRFGYWDSLRKGLLAGEQLHLDLKRLDIAYMDQNKREYEITKHISLAQLAPLALLALKEKGECSVTIPEALFDLDYPGHYLRRIKSVSITIPCVTGPYTGVPCTLTLLKSTIRHGKTLTGGKYARQGEADQGEGDSRFADSFGAIQSIVTSSAQNDHGLFELNLGDQRYLPCEGVGACSTLRLELPQQFKQFDHNTITDVVIQMRYTAREGGKLLKDQCVKEMMAALNAVAVLPGQDEDSKGLVRLFSLRHDFPNEWHRLKQSNTAKLTVRLDQLPFFVQDHTPTVDTVTWLARVTNDPATYAMSVDGEVFDLTPDPSLNNLVKGTSDPIALDTQFTLAAGNTAELEELLLLVRYTLGS